MKKPTDIDRYTKKRYYQLLQTTDKSYSNAWNKTILNRRLRRRINHKCHMALTNPKIDISKPYRVDTYHLTERGQTHTPIGTHPTGYGNIEPIRNGPDPSYREIRRLPEWMKAKIRENLRYYKDRLSFRRRWYAYRIPEPELPIKLDNE